MAILILWAIAGELCPFRSWFFGCFLRVFFPKLGFASPSAFERLSTASTPSARFLVDVGCVCMVWVLFYGLFAVNVLVYYGYGWICFSSVIGGSLIHGDIDGGDDDSNNVSSITGVFSLLGKVFDGVFGLGFWRGYSGFLLLAGLNVKWRRLPLPRFTDGGFQPGYGLKDEHLCSSCRNLVRELSLLSDYSLHRDRYLRFTLSLGLSLMEVNGGVSCQESQAMFVAFICGIFEGWWVAHSDVDRCWCSAVMTLGVIMVFLRILKEATQALCLGEAKSSKRIVQDLDIESPRYVTPLQSSLENEVASEDPECWSRVDARSVTCGCGLLEHGFYYPFCNSMFKHGVLLGLVPFVRLWNSIIQHCFNPRRLSISMWIVLLVTLRLWLWLLFPSPSLVFLPIRPSVFRCLMFIRQVVPRSINFTLRCQILLSLSFMFVAFKLLFVSGL